MDALYTVEEKSLEWGVSPRRIQQLCREGNIEGAVKRAGAWFIPESVPSPVKNTKAEAGPYNFSGTKMKLFENSIELFSRKGYENVTVHDLTELSGVSQSAVYNHFTSKKAVIETIYGYFRHHFTSNRPSPEELEAMLETMDFTELLAKDFRHDYDENVKRHIDSITKIILERVSTDGKAAEIFQKLILDDEILFVDNVLKKAVKLGKIIKVNTHDISVLINSVKTYSLLCGLTGQPGQVNIKANKDEQKLYRIIAALLTNQDQAAGS